MSEYFRTLNRMEREQEELYTPLASESAANPETESCGPVCSSRQLSRDKAAAFGTLFDGLRALANGRPIKSVVLAGASGFEGVHTVADGLAQQFASRKLSVLVAELVEEEARPLLRLANGCGSGELMAESEPDEDGGNPLVPLPLDLRGGPVSADLKQWIELASATHALTIIEGPPLGQSLDAAMVARACDGLVIIVEPEATAEKALQVGVQRAQAVGCHLLGMVMSGTQDYTPKWLRQLSHSPGR